MNGEDVFTTAPSLPEWLDAELPFERRVFRGREYAMHFVDEGNGPVVVLQHGNPTWCYLWRKVIRILLDEGLRVIAPDLIGLGLSDKPRDPSLHTVPFHGRNLLDLLDASGVDQATIVGQDWGGPMIAMAAALNPERVRGAVFANTGLRAPKRPPRVTRFHRFANRPVLSTLAFKLLNFPIPVLHKAQGDSRSIGRKERRAYRYPLRRWRDRTAPLSLARLVPTSLDHPTVNAMTAVESWARSFEGPVQLVWGMRDPILGRSLRATREIFPAAKTIETQAGHFLQEEVPDELAIAILEVVERVGA